jgi:hypothetical protein
METTLNMHVDVLRHITRAAHSKGITRTEMIIILIKRVMDENGRTIRMGKMVKYQKQNTNGYWHKFHVILREDEYEYFLDLRKLLKMSVSLILAYAVEKYLIQLVDGKITDNYRFVNYVIVKEIVENVICWRFYWGCPPSLKKYL